jgi:hypothetical protein
VVGVNNCELLRRELLNVLKESWAHVKKGGTAEVNFVPYGMGFFIIKK